MISLLEAIELRDVSELANKIVEASEQHVSDRLSKGKIVNDEDVADFRVSCDALNLWRLRLRFEEERVPEVEALFLAVRDDVCRTRQYEPDEFQMALTATSSRVRTPFGLDPLQLAEVRSQRRPIRLLKGELQQSGLATKIAAIARQLQEDVGDGSILLPVDHLRELLNKRKIVISGALKQLGSHGLIETVNDKYHTRKAREFKFVGQEGVDFEFVAGEQPCEVTF